MAPGDHVAVSFLPLRPVPAVSGRVAGDCANFNDINFAGRAPTVRTRSDFPMGEPCTTGCSASRRSRPCDRHERNTVKVRGRAARTARPARCGIQTGAGTVLRALGVGAGASFAVIGAGAVGLSAVMAARVAGATTIIAVDVSRPGSSSPASSVRPT